MRAFSEEVKKIISSINKSRMTGMTGLGNEKLRL